MKTENIRQGATFAGYPSAAGMVITVAGIILAIYNFNSPFSYLYVPLGIIVFLVGFIFFISLRGVLIDVEKRQIKPYSDILVARIGQWQSLDRFDRITLDYTSESQTMNSRGNSSHMLTRLFRLSLRTGNEGELMIKEFIEYPDAVRFLEEYSIKLNLDKQNYYETLMERIEEREEGATGRRGD
jgi:hypothetical protein